jgi:5,10-methylenetetrahydromethanopterin reductase
MRLAIGFNPVLPIREAIRLAQRVESKGYESIWFHESLYQRDIVTYISSIALSTSTIKIGSGIVNTFTRHPVTAAITFATLGELSKGRVIMGIGLGSFPTIPKIGYKIFPVNETRPLLRIREYVDIVRNLWTGQNVTLKGNFFTVEDLKLEVNQELKIQIYIASLSQRTLSYAGAKADGAILSPALNTAEATARMVNFVREGERNANRVVDKASYILTSLDPDPAKAREVVRSFYFFLYQLAEIIKPADLEEYDVKPESLERFREAWRKKDLTEAKRLVPEAAIDAITLSGKVDEAEERLTRFIKSGVDLPILMPIGNVDYAIDVMSHDLR